MKNFIYTGILFIIKFIVVHILNNKEKIMIDMQFHYSSLTIVIIADYY